MVVPPEHSADHPESVEEGPGRRCGEGVRNDLQERVGPEHTFKHAQSRSRKSVVEQPINRLDLARSQLMGSKYYSALNAHQAEEVVRETDKHQAVYEGADVSTAGDDLVWLHIDIRGHLQVK